MRNYSLTLNEYSFSLQHVKKITRKRIKVNYILFTIVSSVLLLVINVTGYAKMVSISSETLLLERENKEIQREIDGIMVLMNDLNKKERIEKIAKGRLKMIYPTKSHIKLIKQQKEN